MASSRVILEAQAALAALRPAQRQEGGTAQRKEAACRCQQSTHSSLR